MLLIKNGYIKTMAGEDIDGGSVLIGDDGKILAVGTVAEHKAKANTSDFEQAFISSVKESI